MSAEAISATTGSGSGATPVKEKVLQGGRKKQFQLRRGFEQPVAAKAQFEEKCDESKGRVCDCSDTRQSDHFMQAAEEIAEFVGRTHERGSDARLCPCRAGAARSSPTASAGRTNARVWEKRRTNMRGARRGSRRTSRLSVHWSGDNKRTSCNRRLMRWTRSATRHLAVTQTSSLEGNEKGLGFELPNFQSQKRLLRALHGSQRCFHRCHRGELVTTQARLKLSQDVIDMTEGSGESIGKDPAHHQDHRRSKRSGHQKTHQRPEKQSCLKKMPGTAPGCGFLVGCGLRATWKRLIKKIEND